MIRKCLAAAILFFSVISLHAQGTDTGRPDYKYIEHVTKDKSSAFYYPKLFSRYQAGDTTLSMQQCKMLYYGFFFQDGYKAYGSVSPLDDSLKQIYNKEKLDDNDRKNIIRYTKEDLKTAPFNLGDLYRLYRIYDASGDEKDAAPYIAKLEMLSKAIAATGDAKTDTTGIHVISVEDEYTIISLLGYEYGGNQTLTPTGCDYLTLKKNDDNMEGLYFDIKQMLIEENKKLNGK